MEVDNIVRRAEKESPPTRRLLSCTSSDDDRLGLFKCGGDDSEKSSSLLGCNRTVFKSRHVGKALYNGKSMVDSDDEEESETSMTSSSNLAKRPHCRASQQTGGAIGADVNVNEGSCWPTLCPSA